MKESEMSMESKWIRIRWMNYTPSGKTSIYSVYNYVLGVHVGEIKFNPGWRKYLFYPYEQTQFDSVCLAVVKHFIDMLMENRKHDQEKV